MTSLSACDLQLIAGHDARCHGDLCLANDRHFNFGYAALNWNIDGGFSTVVALGEADHRAVGDWVAGAVVYWISLNQKSTFAATGFNAQVAGICRDLLHYANFIGMSDGCAKLGGPFFFRGCKSHPGHCVLRST